jgi:glycerol dehydrogenase
MSRMLLAPGRYIQGAGAIKEIGEHAVKLGGKALLTGGKTALVNCGEDIQVSLKNAGVLCHQTDFGGECCDDEIDRLGRIGRENSCDLVIAAGGGKIIDTGKAVAHDLKVPVMIVPTIAATDAPCSALSVVYTKEGVFDRYLVLPNNPNCVLVDTAIIAKAPAHFLVSGMGDALATYWEADTCAKSCKPNALTGSTPPTLSALALAKLCYKILLEHGVAAKLAVEQGVVTPAVEAVVEANTLLSGLGFESGGLAGSHSVHNGLTVLEKSHGKLHGEKVAFGVSTQLVLEGRPRQDLKTVLEFCLSVGLPVCLEDLGIENATEEEIFEVAKAACAEGETIHSTWFEISAEKVAGAIWAADAIGRQAKQ